MVASLRRLFLGLGREQQWIALAPASIRRVRRLGFRYILRVDSDDARTAPMCSDHHTHGLILTEAKFRLQNHDDEFTRRIVVIDQDDLVKAGSLDLEFILGGRSRVDVTHVRAAGHALAGAEPASARRRLASM